MSQLTVAIVAGGLATRLYPTTLKVPKSMLTINGNPFIDWQLRYLANQGIDRVVLCLGNLANQIIDFIGNGERYHLKIDFSVEKSPLGTGGALKKASNLLGETFGILYGDSYLTIKLSPIFNSHLKSNKLISMTVFENKNNYDKSNVKFTSKGTIRYLKNEPTDDMNYIDYGFLVMNRKALEQIPSETFYDLSDLLEKFSETDQVFGHKVFERFYEIGSREGIIDLTNYLVRESK